LARVGRIDELGADEARAKLVERMVQRAEELEYVPVDGNDAESVVYAPVLRRRKAEVRIAWKIHKLGIRGDAYDGEYSAIVGLSGVLVPSYSWPSTTIAKRSVLPVVVRPGHEVIVAGA
jgi:hypothetical protein